MWIEKKDAKTEITINKNENYQHYKNHKHEYVFILHYKSMIQLLDESDHMAILGVFW